MIQPLRSWHRRIFLLLAVLLPILFAAGLLARHRLLPATAASSVNSANPTPSN